MPRRFIMLRLILLATSYLISILAYFVQKRNRKYENGYVLGTTMTHYNFQSDEVREILSEEALRRKRILVFFFIIPLSLFLAKTELVMLYIFVLNVLALSIGLSYSTWLSVKKLRKIKASWQTPGQDHGSRSRDSEDEFYDLFGYKNPNDPRAFVPSRLSSGNLEINRGRKAWSFLYLSLTILVLGLVLSMGFFLSPASYKISYTKDEMDIRAKLYKDEIKFSDMVLIDLVDELPSGKTLRTNGTSSQSQAYGSFQIEGVGKARLYIYKDVSPLIHIQTKTNSFYINMEDKAKTEALYNSIKSNLNNYNKDK